MANRKRGRGPYVVTGHGLGTCDVDSTGRRRRYASERAAIAAAKYLLRGGYATRFADGDVGVYSTLSGLRRDSTGEHAGYTVRSLADVDGDA